MYINKKFKEQIRRKTIPLLPNGVNSDKILGQKYYSLLNCTCDYCGQNELINILLVVHMKNGKNNQRIYLFGNLERNKTTTNLE